MPVDRRELFKIVGAGLVAQDASAQHEHRPPAAKPGDYAPRALSVDEYAILQRLLEVLLPADENSPSAREAGAGRYIDTTLKYADEKLRQTWTSGLNAIDQVARTAGQPFIKMDSAAATEILLRIASNESHPETGAEKFFVVFKRAAIDAYYLSDAGRKSLGYVGDTAIRVFPGCTHPEHKANAI